MKIGEKHIEFVLPANLEELSNLRRIIKIFYFEFLDSILVHRITTSMDEIFSNTIEHGKQGKPHDPIRFRLKKLGTTFQVTIADNSQFFDPNSFAEDTEERLERGEDGGYGLNYIRSLFQIRNKYRNSLGNIFQITERKSQ